MLKNFMSSQVKMIFENMSENNEIRFETCLRIGDLQQCSLFGGEKKAKEA